MKVFSFLQVWAHAKQYSNATDWTRSRGAEWRFANSQGPAYMRRVYDKVGFRKSKAWDDESAYTESQKYNKMCHWRDRSPGSFSHIICGANAELRDRVHQEFAKRWERDPTTKHYLRRQLNKKERVWNHDKVFCMARHCKNRTEFMTKHIGAYMYARKRGKKFMEQVLNVIDSQVTQQ